MDMQMKPIAAGLASLGRGGDSTLVHMTPREVAGLQALAMKHGGSLTINPQTGLPEAGFLSNLIPTIAGIGLSFTPAAPFAPLIVGGLTALTSGSLKKGLMAGLGAWGAGQLSSAFQGMGEAAAGEAAKIVGQQAGGSEVARMLGESAKDISPAALGDIMQQEAYAAAAPQYLNYAPGVDGAGPTWSSTAAGGTSPYSTAYNAAYTPAVKQAIADISPVEKALTGAKEFGKKLVDSPISAVKDLAGTPIGEDDKKKPMGYLPIAAAAAPLAMTGIGALSKQPTLPAGIAGQAGVAPASYTAYNFTPGRRYNPQTGLFEEQPTFTGGYRTPTFPYAQGGTVPNLNQKYPQSDITRAMYASSPQVPQSAEVLDGYGPKMNPFTGQVMLARGGLADLHEYAAGGKLLSGPGDGMSDDIPAVIKGPKPQRAALADGEFVVPADVVSHLGNGSTQAGAKRLYAMMDKVRTARTGRKAQGRQINADRFVPA